MTVGVFQTFFTRKSLLNVTVDLGPYLTDSNYHQQLNLTNLIFWYQNKHYLNKKNHGTDQNRKLLVKKLQVVLRDRFPTRASLEKYVTHNSYEYNNEIYSLSLPV